MSDQTIPEDLRARLVTAGRVRHVSSHPDETTTALAAEVRAFNLCANISSGTNGYGEAPWAHHICILPPDHLGYHEAASPDDYAEANWSLDRHELERRAELWRDRALRAAPIPVGADV